MATNPVLRAGLDLRRPRQPWDLIIVGGGPATALQIRTAPPGARLLVVSPSVGGGMEMLGHQRLQSYLDELCVGAVRSTPHAYTEPWATSPTGTQYSRYVRDAIHAGDAPVVPLTVVDVWPDCGLLKVVGHDHGGSQVVLEGRSVVLATGCRPRPAPFGNDAPGIRAHTAVYWDIAQSRLDRYRNRPLVIVGSGNTAMQLAACLARISGDVTILATKYPGIFPQETEDRFAWRAPSQLTCEMIAKSGLRSLSSEPPGIAVRFIIYDELTIMRSGAAIEFSYRRERNGNVLGRHSLPPYHPAFERFRTSLGPDRWRERRDLETAVLVSAIGVAPAYPEGTTLKRLERDARGHIGHADGRTSLPGLYLAGICAGFPAVNFMKTAGVDFGGPHASSWSEVPDER